MNDVEEIFILTRHTVNEWRVERSVCSVLYSKAITLSSPSDNLSTFQVYKREMCIALSASGKNIESH